MFTVYVIVVYQPPSYLSKNIKHLSQFMLHFSAYREVILIGYFNLPSINWGNVHAFQGDVEPTTQVFIDTYVSSGMSQ